MSSTPRRTAKTQHVRLFDQIRMHACLLPHAGRQATLPESRPGLQRNGERVSASTPQRKVITVVGRGQPLRC